jgi:hypothetical protein
VPATRSRGATHRRDPRESSFHSSEAGLPIIDLFLECPDMFCEMAMALPQPPFKAFYFLGSQFIDVETFANKVAH